MELYIMGGGYPKHDQNGITYEHRAVHPTNGKPYVFTRPNGSTTNLCKHHSHLYRLDPGNRTATLVKPSAEATGVKAPQTLTLTHDQFQGIQDRINGHGSNGVYDG